MNYSTLKKTLALSFVSLMAVGAANAQMADTTKSAMMTTPKLFGGSAQYNTWSIGLNVGVTSMALATGGTSDFVGNKVALGYGLSIKKDLVHSFGLQFDLTGGKVEGSAGNVNIGGVVYPKAITDPTGDHWSAFSTTFWQGSISGVFNFATVDYLRRKNAVNFFVSAGAGLASYKPTDFGANTPGFPTTNYTYSKNVTSLVIPVGLGVKFRVTDAVAINLGYTENFIDADNFDGINLNYPTRDKYSYGYAGVNFTLGSKSKPNLEWANPIAIMYDELYDEALRQEVAALKGRVGKVEDAVRDLKKDSDGDGVSDQFDKCPNTPAGTVVDGSGCPIVFPKPIDTSLFMRKPVGGAAVAYSNIQFEFDSSVLRTSSYPVLDATSADLRASGATCTLAGYASSEGTAAHNMRLSKDRANSVKTYLVNSGVEAKKLKVKAFGETHPIADNSTEEGRVLNRRVEFKK